MPRPVKLLFVCTANVCRSPLAAGLMAHHATAEGGSVRVASGSIDRDVRPTHPMVVTLLEERGVSLRRLQSQPLTAPLVDGADIIAVMTAEHARHVVGRFPSQRRKVLALDHLVSELPMVEPGDTVDDWLARIYTIGRDYSSGTDWDIEDPINRSENVFRAVDTVIDNAVGWLAQVIAQLR